MHQRPGPFADSQLLLDARGFTNQGEGCETLEQGGGGGLGGDSFRKGTDAARGGYGGVFRVGSVAEVGDAVAGGEAGVFGGDYGAGGFFACD